MRTLSDSSYGFNSPGLMIAGGGDVWVLNAGDNSVTEIGASDGGFVRKLSGASYGSHVTSGLAVSGGRLWVTDPAGNSVIEVNASTGAIVRKLSGGKYGFRVAIGPGLRRRSPLDSQSGGQLGHRDQPRHRRVYPADRGHARPDASWPRLAASSGYFARTPAFSASGSAVRGRCQQRRRHSPVHRRGAFTWAADGRSSLWAASSGSPAAISMMANSGTVQEIDTSSDTFVRHLPRTSSPPGHPGLRRPAPVGRHRWADRIPGRRASGRAEHPRLRRRQDQGADRAGSERELRERLGHDRVAARRAGRACPARTGGLRSCRPPATASTVPTPPPPRPERSGSPTPAGTRSPRSAPPTTAWCASSPAAATGSAPRSPRPRTET